MKDTWLQLHNGQPAPLAHVPSLAFAAFREDLMRLIRGGGGRVSAFFAHPDDSGMKIYAVLAFDSQGCLKVASASVKDEYPALTCDCLELHLFEREIHEKWGIVPKGHPWLKPVRFLPRSGKGESGAEIFSRAPFFQMEGDEVHEVAVGPVHAGIIEPGHFRFQCQGETVHHLEIALGYQHRGVEPALTGGPDARTVHYMETLAGDTTIGHLTAYCEAVEALSKCPVSEKAEVLRAVALELERLANHTGDLGALAHDVGYLPSASYLGRLRGDFLNMTAVLCGSRFGRGFLRPGGVYFDLDGKRIAELDQKIAVTFRDVSSAVELMWESSSVLSRFEDAGILNADLARELGVVGPAARAAGIERDIRNDFPSGLYRFSQIPVSVCAKGDVFSRAFVRWLEIQRSVEFIRKQLTSIPPGDLTLTLHPLLHDAIVVTLAEGWRGEICHVALTDRQGRFARYKAVDPSFHNWIGLAQAMRGEEISDFPMCNKSFNLSYCGHDL